MFGSQRLAAHRARCDQQLAAPFAERHRAHLSAGSELGCNLVLVALPALALAGVLAPVALGWEDWRTAGWGLWVRAAIATAFLVMFGVGLVLACREQFQIRLLPYFEREVGDTDTWLAGEHLLWHSKALDDAASRLGLTPLSAFSSGDDLIRGETLRWFDAGEALPTIKRLLEPEIIESFPAGVASDLQLLQQALQRAAAQQIRFGLMLRESSGASGHEMSLRRGSFF